MAKGRSPSEKKSRTLRVSIGDYLLLAELSRKLDITMAKALHLAITKQATSELAVTPRTQIPMALNAAYQVIPELAATISPELAIAVTPKSKIATNGSKGAAFRIKPRGARYD